MKAEFGVWSHFVSGIVLIFCYPCLKWGQRLCTFQAVVSRHGEIFGCRERCSAVTALNFCPLLQEKNIFIRRVRSGVMKHLWLVKVLQRLQWNWQQLTGADRFSETVGTEYQMFSTKAFPRWSWWQWAQSCKLQTHDSPEHVFWFRFTQKRCSLCAPPRWLCDANPIGDIWEVAFKSVFPTWAPSIALMHEGTFLHWARWHTTAAPRIPGEEHTALI